MKRVQTPAVALTEKLCRPQRIGVFGHRGAGKTTLLTMLYREAVGGRLAGLRLAAADARTASYLGEKVLQLEAGQPLPATLGETELRLHLYHKNTRIELLFKDYQGEHVALGREEPIRDFLRDCDAIWLCLDVPVTASPDSCLRSQQEVEQVIEDYLQAEQPGTPPRPTALLLTKADLLQSESSPALPSPEEVAQRYFRMTLHTLALHSPQHATLAVSSLGSPIPPVSEEAAPPPFSPQPVGLDGPLVWLAEALQAQDEQRLDHLWQLAPRDLSLLTRATHSFCRRYPSTAAAAAFQKRLQAAQRRHQVRNLAGGLVGAACMLLGLWTYDAWGMSRVQQRAAELDADPIAAQQEWQSFQRWHPTRRLLHPQYAPLEQAAEQDLAQRIAARKFADGLAELQRRAADPTTDAEEAWQRLQQLEEAFPNPASDPSEQALREQLRKLFQDQRQQRARLAFEELERLQTRAEPAVLLERADHFLQEHAGTSYEPEVRRRRALYLARLDERDIEGARAYSAQHPLNFYTRRQSYQRYLDRHPQGAFAEEAKKALVAIEAAWDRHDFRLVRDHFESDPGDVKQLQPLCRSYLAVHPQGRFRASANELLRWSERVSAPGEYKVVLRSGDFDHQVAYWLSRGPSLSVEIEVNGVHYGPSTIVTRRYDPDWNYEFPRRIRWKLGDAVRIHVVDHYFWKRHVLDIDSESGDALALRMLSGDVHSGKHTLTFESDFTMPQLPQIEE
jgi:hypothetical protein